MTRRRDEPGRGRMPSPPEFYTPRVWLKGHLLYVQQPFGGCWDVIRVTPVGVIEAEEETPQLPADAIRFVEDEEHLVEQNLYYTNHMKHIAGMVGAPEVSFLEIIKGIERLKEKANA